MTSTSSSLNRRTLLGSTGAVVASNLVSIGKTSSTSTPQPTCLSQLPSPSFLARTMKPRGAGRSARITSSSITIGLTKVGTMRPGNSRSFFPKRFARPSDRSANSAGSRQRHRLEGAWQKSATKGSSRPFWWSIPRWHDGPQLQTNSWSASKNHSVK